MPHVSLHALKSKLATTLRRMADRLAPAPAGDCGSGLTWINYSVDGADFTPPGITFSWGGGGTFSGNQVAVDQRFKSGEGWSPA